MVISDTADRELNSDISRLTCIAAEVRVACSSGVPGQVWRRGRNQGMQVAIFAERSFEQRRRVQQKIGVGDNLDIKY